MKRCLLLFALLLLFSEWVLAETGGGCCFTSGTKISMADGSYKNIEDVDIGDIVWSFDADTSDLIEAEVRELEQPMREGYYSIEFSDGSILNATNDHPMYMKDLESGNSGWGAIDVDASSEEYNLQNLLKMDVGDSVMNLQGDFVIITSMEYIEGEIKTYTLKEVGDEKNFFAEGFLVHNKPDDPPFNKRPEERYEKLRDDWEELQEFFEELMEEWRHHEEMHIQNPDTVPPPGPPPEPPPPPEEQIEKDMGIKTYPGTTVIGTDGNWIITGKYEDPSGKVFEVDNAYVSSDLGTIIWANSVKTDSFYAKDVSMLNYNGADDWDISYAKHINFDDTDLFDVKNVSLDFDNGRIDSISLKSNVDNNTIYLPDESFIDLNEGKGFVAKFNDDENVIKLDLDETSRYVENNLPVPVFGIYVPKNQSFSLEFKRHREQNTDMDSSTCTQCGFVDFTGNEIFLNGRVEYERRNLIYPQFSDIVLSLSEGNMARLIMDDRNDLVNTLLFSGNLARFFSGPFEVKIQDDDNYFRFVNKKGIPFIIELIDPNIRYDSRGFLNRTLIDEGNNSFQMIAYRSYSGVQFNKLYYELLMASDLSYIYER